MRPENRIKKEPSGLYTHMNKETIAAKKIIIINHNIHLSSKMLARALKVLLSCGLMREGII